MDFVSGGFPGGLRLMYLKIADSGVGVRR